MADANDVGQLNGVYRKRYAKKISYVWPEDVMFVRMFPFAASDAFGDDWNEPVALTRENGFTLVEASSTGSPAINDAVAGSTKNANVNSPQIYLQSELNYEAASRAMKKGEAAIAKAITHVIRNNTESHRSMQEIQIFHGQTDLGVVESRVSGAGGTITITKATWSPGSWAGREGLKVDALNTGLTGETDADMIVTAVNFATRTITFNAVDAGVGATDRLFVKDACAFGAPATFREPLGVQAALASSGTVYGIPTGNFSLWKAGAVDAGGNPCDFEHFTEAVARAAEKGGTGLLTGIVNPHSFNDLVGDQAALRSYDEEGSTAMYRTGARAIRFFTGNGEVSVKPSIYCKRGFSLVINPKTWSRKGSQDFSFSSPFSTEAFHVFEGKGGAFARSYSSTTPFCRALGQNVLISGIVDSVPN